jgi:hypothetical protein
MSLSDIKKSIDTVFTERISSPFYGTFILSWAIWNWQIIYVTVFVDQERLQPITKLQYVVTNYTNWWHLVVFPFLSTAFLIALLPWVVNKALQIHLFYEKQRVKMRESLDEGRRLTIEQSVQIRSQVNQQIEQHEKNIQSKDAEIKSYKLILEKVEADKKAFKIISAIYGIDGKWKDVKERVYTYLTTHEQTFIVSNENLGDDPAPGLHKILIISYNVNNEAGMTVAKEQYEVIFREEIVYSRETENSKNLYKELPTLPTKDLELQDIKNIEVLFPGSWRLEYSGELNGDELVQLRDGNEYFATKNSTQPYKHYFNIEDIDISLNAKLIKFTKVGVFPDNRKTTSTLRIIDLGRHYEGVEENANVKVVYKRID